MGTYLSTPVTEKNEESGESLQCPVTPLAWGVMDMQGWRKSMEDSHVAQTDIDVPAHHFDGPATKNVNVDGKVCILNVFLRLCSTSDISSSMQFELVFMLCVTCCVPMVDYYPYRYSKFKPELEYRYSLFFVLSRAYLLTCLLSLPLHYLSLHCIVSHSGFCRV
jgi:hypothetical protein